MVEGSVPCRQASGLSIHPSPSPSRSHSSLSPESHPVVPLRVAAQNTRVLNRQNTAGHGNIRVVQEWLPDWIGERRCVFDLVNATRKIGPGNRYRPRGDSAENRNQRSGTVG